MEALLSILFLPSMCQQILHWNIYWFIQMYQFAFADTPHILRCANVMLTAHSCGITPHPS